MPAKQPKSSGQQHKDPYAQRGKQLGSQVQRLRGWVGTDASRRPELVDALNALVAHRLDGHAYAASGADAQDAVKQSADLLLASGPIGPYSSATDAVRCGTALVQLAALQAGIGLVDAADGTLDSWEGIRRQVAEAGTVVELGPDAGRHALVVAARVALAREDAAAANAYADAARAVPGPAPDEAGFGTVDLDRLTADARWAAGHEEQSLGFLHAAKEAYEALAGERLAEPGRLSPAVAERLGEPLPGLYRDLADRLGLVGETDLAVANRRLVVERLRALAGRTETFRGALAAAMTDLAADLVRAGRAEEALAAAHEAEVAAADRSVSGTTRVLTTAVLVRASIRAERPAPAAPLRGLLAAEGEAAGPPVVAFGSAVLAEALLAEGLAEAARAARGGSTEDVVVLEARARGVVLRGDGTVRWSPLEPASAYGAPLGDAGGPGGFGVPTWLEQERAEARRQESARADEARREAEERATAEARSRQAEEAAAATRAAAESRTRAEEEARRAAAEQAEQAERKRRREERLRQHQAEVDAREREQRAARRAEIDDRLGELDAAEEQERDRLLAERAALDDADVVGEPEPVAKPEPVVAPEPVAAPEPVEDADLSEALRQAQGASAEPEPEPVEDADLSEALRQAQGASEALRQAQGASEALRQAQGTSEALRQAQGASAEPEPEPDDLDVAEQGLREARGRGGRREVRAAAEAVAAILRVRFGGEPDTYAARLRAALEDLSSARLRSGDLFGARAASREARTLR